MAEQRAYSPAEAGRILGVSRDSILRRIADGTIRPVKFGRRILIPKTEVEFILRGAAPRVEPARQAQQ